MLITNKIFSEAEDKGVLSWSDLDNITEKDTIIKCTIDDTICYVICNSFFDNFTETNTINQIVIYATKDVDSDEFIINQVKSRHLMSIALQNDTYEWTRWKTEDSSAYNYLKESIGIGGQTTFKQIIKADNESGILVPYKYNTDLVINRVDKELIDDGTIDTNTEEYSNQLFLAEDTSLDIIPVVSMPSPSIIFEKQYLTPSITADGFIAYHIYRCVVDDNNASGNNSSVYKWIDITTIGHPNVIYIPVRECDDIIFSSDN